MGCVGVCVCVCVGGGGGGGGGGGCKERMEGKRVEKRHCLVWRGCDTVWGGGGVTLWGEGV